MDFNLLRRMENSDFKFSQGLLLDRLFIYYPVSPQTLDEDPDAIMGAELERCVTLSSVGSVGSCSSQIQEQQGQLQRQKTKVQGGIVVREGYSGSLGAVGWGTGLAMIFQEETFELGLGGCTKMTVSKQRGVTIS